MKKPTKLQTLVLETLESWKEAFLQDSYKQELLSMGVTTTRDYLENISYDGYSCYASFLFNDLTPKDKQYIVSNLPDGISFIDFDELWVEYDLED